MHIFLLCQHFYAYISKNNIFFSHIDHFMIICIIFVEVKMDDTKTIFSQRIIYLREKLKLSQTDISNIAKVSQSNIARYEAMKTEATITPLANIAKGLNVTTDYLLGIETVEKETAPEFPQEQLQVIELIKKLNNKELEKVYNYLLGIIDARD